MTVARAGDEPSLSEQLIELGRQAKATGATVNAHGFFKEALKLDPKSEAARQGLKATEGVMQVAFQDPQPAAAKPAQTPPPPPAAQAGDAKATIEQSVVNENIARQQLTSDVEQRLQAARALLNQGLAEAALNALRLTQNVVRSASSVPQDERDKLNRRIEAQMLQTVQAEERVIADRAEHARLESAAEQRTRTIDLFQRNKLTIQAMMIQFDTLMSQGVYNVLYNGGMGDISLATAPFGEARLLAQKAYALQRGGPLPYGDNDPSPAAGMNTAYYMGFLSQELQFRQLERYRLLLTLQDVSRAAVPFPDTITIEYPPAEHWREISEKRIKRYESVSLDARDPKTQRIVLPQECTDAYQKYLELAPTGPFAGEVAGILQQAGEKVSSSYKASKGGKK